jgi:hypothetical protein
MTKKLLALDGLKWNPFAPELPSEALLTTPNLDRFCWRLEQSHVRDCSRSGWLLPCASTVLD